jgi:hypothetical protein
MFLKIKKIVGAVAATIFLVAWFADGSVENNSVLYPRTPNPEQSRTIPHAVKGIVVYITKEEQSLLSWLHWIEIGSGLVIVLVALIHRGNPFSSKK